jgi:hypothetical protein
VTGRVGRGGRRQSAGDGPRGRRVQTAERRWRRRDGAAGGSGRRRGAPAQADGARRVVRRRPPGRVGAPVTAYASFGDRQGPPLCCAGPQRPTGAVGGQPSSSRGLGHRPFKAAARVRIPLGAHGKTLCETGSRTGAGPGPVEQFGVLATLSRWRPRVQIPSGPQCVAIAPFAVSVHPSLAPRAYKLRPAAAFDVVCALSRSSGVGDPRQCPPVGRCATSDQGVGPVPAAHGVSRHGDQAGVITVALALRLAAGPLATLISPRPQAGRASGQRPPIHSTRLRGQVAQSVRASA